MLKKLELFRNTLDDIMLQAMHKSVLLYGYESYTGRFIKWYAEYYHNIKIDYLVSSDMSRGRAYDVEVFRPSILEFDYRDVKNAVIWVVEPMTEETESWLQKNGYKKNDTYFDFFEAVYGTDMIYHNAADTDIFNRKKEGQRDIQFLEWLEWKYDCNFVTRIARDTFDSGEHNSGYGCTTQKEIFTILDRCHIIPEDSDAIFDYGCGKGGAIVSFLDYGFHRAGGVEYEQKIYEVLQKNLHNLGLEEQTKVLRNDAALVDQELDVYNWFYFYLPFDNTVFEKCVDQICKSYERKRRKMRIISISPYSHQMIENTGIFRLTNQFTIDLRQRVVHLYETR